MKRSVDVVVCTKDRPQLLPPCIAMITKLIPCINIYVFEGSLKPNWKVLNQLKDQFGTKVVLVPHLKFGAVRNLIMTSCTSKFVAMVDDDITLEKDWFPTLMSELKGEKVVAVSSKLIFGEGAVKKLSWANKRTSGGSGGAAIYDRKAVLSLGNFDKNIHRGEDMELELRIHAAGKRWVKTQRTCAYHPITLQEFLERPKANVCGWDFIMRYSKHRVTFISVRFASTFIMPIYYLWQTLDLRCAGIWFIYKLKSLIYYLSGRYREWS